MRHLCKPLNHKNFTKNRKQLKLGIEADDFRVARLSGHPVPEISAVEFVTYLPFRRDIFTSVKVLK